MKIFFSLKPPKGSYGGGAFFVNNLVSYLKQQNINVTYNLENDINIIIIIDPRKGKNKKYSCEDIYNYKKKNPNTLLIHRVNECDIKREKSIKIEPKILSVMKNVDYIIFVSNWLKNYYISKYKLELPNSKFILNGCNHNYFYPLEKNKILTEKINLVTHHWSDNYLKGFDIYNKLDKLLETTNKFTLTFIGNYNKKYKPKNITILSPKSGAQLGDILRHHDIYLTATQNEPGGAHYLEGMSCGLPVLYYKNGGGVKEICIGEEFNDIDDFFVKLELIKNNYNEYCKKINYTYLNADRSSKEYYDLLSTFIK